MSPSLLLGLTLWGCSPQAPEQEVSQGQPQQEVTYQGRSAPRVQAAALRISHQGGVPRLYRLPTLTEVPQALRGRLPPVDRVVGLDSETEVLFVQTSKKELLALDLESGRADTIVTDVEQATLGPDGTLYAVDKNRRVVSLARRVRFTWPQPLGGVPTELFGSTDQRLVAVMREAGPRLVTAAPDQPPSSHDIPSGGDVAAAFWGDALAVAGDSGVILVDPLGLRPPSLIRLADPPRALLFSPSGHRIYAARRGGLGLAVIDRYEGEELDGIALPGPAATMRLDPYGRWLLARPALGDSAWVVDLPIKALKGGLATSWRADLPAVAPDGTLLLRQADDVVAYRADSLRAVGRAAGAGRDLWFVTTWRPRFGPGRGGPAPSEQAGPSEVVGGEGVFYVQVSVSQNNAWSAEMAQQLSRAGLQARVLPPPADRPDDGYRVVLGPYSTRAQAETIGRKLGRAFWIYQPEP